MKPLRLALIGAAMAAPASAQSVQFSAVADSEIGYATNPLLAPGVTKGSVFVSASIQPRLFYQTARSTTALQGKYSREKYFNGFGYTDAGSISLVRTDQLTQYLGTTLTASYTTTNRDTFKDPEQVILDPLNIGRRTRTFSGAYQLQWQASARDQLTYGAQISHLSYGSGQIAGIGGIPSNYTQYGVNAGYNHVVDARTTVGAQIAVNMNKSKIYPDSRTISPAVTAKRQLSAAWEVDGHVGVNVSRIDGPLARTSTSLGVGVNLCGTYPLWHVCFNLSRDTQPSGYGPLRTVDAIGIQVVRSLDEHSRISLSGRFTKNASGKFEVLGQRPLSDGKAFFASADYDRDITERISAGFGGQYRSRDLSAEPLARSYSATIHLKAKLGRM